MFFKLFFYCQGDDGVNQIVLALFQRLDRLLSIYISLVHNCLDVSIIDLFVSLNFDRIYLVLFGFRATCLFKVIDCPSPTYAFVRSEFCG